MKQFCRTVVNRVGLQQAAAVVLLIACFALAATAFAQSGSARSVEGTVYGANSQPVSSAVVYLQDSKTNNIKSFISTATGSYRFGQLSTDIDYQLWAELNGKKSDKKTISSFNSKKQLTIDLHIKD